MPSGFSLQWVLSDHVWAKRGQVPLTSQTTTLCRVDPSTPLTWSPFVSQRPVPTPTDLPTPAAPT